MAFVDLLAAICITVNASNGVSMIQLSRDLDCRYKTAFVLAHKLREAMALEVRTGEVLDGHVEVDGAYFGGDVRPENRKKDRKDRRLKENRRDRRCVVVAFRERHGRTLPLVARSGAEGVALARYSGSPARQNVGRRGLALEQAPRGLVVNWPPFRPDTWA